MYCITKNNINKYIQFYSIQFISTLLDDNYIAYYYLYLFLSFDDSSLSLLSLPNECEKLSSTCDYYYHYYYYCYYYYCSYYLCPFYGYYDNVFCETCYLFFDEKVSVLVSKGSLSDKMLIKNG